MCFAIPMRLEEVFGDRGMVVASGVRREVRLDLLEGPQAGDFVLVHAGFAIQMLDETEARRTIELIGDFVDANDASVK